MNSLIPRKFFLDSLLDEFSEPYSTSLLKSDIYEDGDNYHVVVDIPGYDKDDIKLTVDKGYLKISAIKEESHEEGGKKYLRQERSFGSVERTFYLGEIEEDEIKAKFDNGTLEVVIPKQAKKESKKIIEIE